MADAKPKDDASTMSFRPGRPTGAGGGSRLVTLESDGKDSPRGTDGPSLQPQWLQSNLKSPGPKDVGRSPAGPPGYPGNDKARWGKEPPPTRSPFNKDGEWRKPGGQPDWEPEGDPNRKPDNRWRDEEREGGGQARAANGFRERWQVDKGGEVNKWNADGGGGNAGDHRRERWGEGGKWGVNARWENDRDKEGAPPPRNKWGPEPDREGGVPPGPRAPPEDGVFRRGNDPWRPSGRGRGGADPPPTGFVIPPGGFARGRGRGRGAGFGGPSEQRPPIGAPPGEFWDHKTPAPVGGAFLERQKSHRYSKEKMLEVFKKVRAGPGYKMPETTAEVAEIMVKEGGDPFAFIQLDDEDKSYYESIRKGEIIRAPPRNKDASEAPAQPLRDAIPPGAGRGRGQPKTGVPGIDEEKTAGEDSFFDAPALSAQRGAGGAHFERAAEARFADAEKTAFPPKGRDDGQPWRRNEPPPVHKEDELRTKDEAPRGGKPPEEGAPKDWRSNRFAEEDRVWRKQGEDKPAADREKKEAPMTPPPKGEELSARADQVPTWRRGGPERTPEKEIKPEESAAHLLPEDLLFGGGKEEAAAESLWDRGEHENDEAYTEGGAEQPARFFYKDPQGETQGPFLQEDIEQWMEAGFFTADLPVRRESLPESAPFVPLGTALPHLKPKTPRMPPGYEQREPEAMRPESAGGVKTEQSLRPGTGKEAGAGAGETAGGQGQQQASIQAPAFSQDNAWPNNSAHRSQQVTKPQTLEQPPRQLQYPSLQPEPPKPQTPQFQEPSLRAQFSGAPDLSFLRGEEAPKPQMPQEQFQPPQALHPHLMGEPHRPAEQPRNADQPPYFPHPAFARGIPQQWPPQERFPQRQEVPDLPPWLMGAHERAQKESQRPEVSLPPPPQPPLSAVTFAQMGGTSEQYIAYLHEQQQLHAHFVQQIHLQRQGGGLSQHSERAPFPGELAPDLQPQMQARSLEQIEAEQLHRLREEAEHQERLRRTTPPEQPPFLRGAFPPEIAPPHLRYPGHEQPAWPPRPPFDTPEQAHHEMMRMQHHEQQLRRAASGAHEARIAKESMQHGGGGGAQPELPPFLQGVLPRERPGLPPQEQSIPPELLAAIQEGRLPVEALAQYLKSLGMDGGRNQGQENPPPAASTAPPADAWNRAPGGGPLPNQEQAREEQQSRPGSSAQSPPWAVQQGPQKTEEQRQGLEVEARARAQQFEEQQRAQFEQMQREHLEESRRQQAPPRTWGAPQSTAQQAPSQETGPSADATPPWGLGQEEVVSFSAWPQEPEPKTGPSAVSAPAQQPKEAPWTAAAPSKRKSLLEIQNEEAVRMKAEQARFEAEQAARIAAGGYGANQSGASPWGGAGGMSRPKTLKEIQEEEARQSAERNVKASQAAGGQVWGPSTVQGAPPVSNRMEKQAQLHSRDTLAEQVMVMSSAPQTPPPVSAREEKKKKASEMTPPVATITPEEEAEFVEASSGKKSKKKGAKGKQAAAASKPAPSPVPMQSASPWAAEAAATRPSLRQLAVEESASTDDTPPEYSSKSAIGPSLADFLPGLHQEEMPQQAPAWNTGGAGSKRMTLKEIQEAEKKEAQRRAAQERARQAAAAAARPVQTQAPSGAPWQRPTPPSAFFPPAASQPNNPPAPKPAPAPAPHADDDDDLFWDYGKDVTITLGNVQPKEPEKPAFPTLSAPPKPQPGNWAAPKAAANTGYKQVAAPLAPNARAPASPGDFPTLAPTGAAATATGSKPKKRGAGTVEPTAAPSFTPATAKAGHEFRRWCEQWTKKITGHDDLTLLDFCMSLPSASEAGDYITQYWGNKSEVSAFKTDFLKRRSAVPPSVLQADFFAGDAAAAESSSDNAPAANAREFEGANDAQKSTATSDAAGKKKGKKGKKVVDNSLLGFSVHSNRINMGVIESAADAQ